MKKARADKEVRSEKIKYLKDVTLVKVLREIFILYSSTLKYTEIGSLH